MFIGTYSKAIEASEMNNIRVTGRLFGVFSFNFKNSERISNKAALERIMVFTFKPFLCLELF